MYQPLYFTLRSAGSNTALVLVITSTSAVFEPLMTPCAPPSRARAPPSRASPQAPEAPIYGCPRFWGFEGPKSAQSLSKFWGFEGPESEILPKACPFLGI